MTIHYLDASSWEAVPEPLPDSRVRPPEPPESSGVQPPPDEPQGPQWGSYGLSEQVLAGLRPIVCGMCVRPIVRRYAYDNLPADTRKRFKRDGILRACGRGLCDRCYKVAQETGKLGEFDIRTHDGQLPLAQRFDLRAEWELVVSRGEHLPEMAEKFGVTIEGLRHSLKKLGIQIDRKVRPDSIERDYLIEEVTFLVGCGLGVHEIAQKFSLTDGELTQRTSEWRLQGLTDIDLQFSDINRKAAA